MHSAPRAVSHGNLRFSRATLQGLSAAQCKAAQGRVNAEELTLGMQRNRNPHIFSGGFKGSIVFDGFSVGFRGLVVFFCCFLCVWKFFFSVI